MDDDGMGIGTTSSSVVGVGQRRRRASSAGGGVNRRGAAIGSKIARKFPLSQYGRVMVRRGTPENIARYGANWRAATPTQRAIRNTDGYYGRGGYWGRLIGSRFGMGDLGDKIGDFAGSAVRSFVPMGGAMMDAAKVLGGAHARYTGTGNYSAVTNSIVNGGQTAFAVPSFAPSVDGSAIVISHKEYVQNIYAPSTGTAFTNTAFQINPGLEDVFPWLSQVAVNYEEYDLKQCMFTFRSTVSDYNSGTGQCGQIIMATQYNASLPKFADKLTMMSYAQSNSSKTTEHQIHGVECDPRQLSGSPGKYVRWQPLGIDQDLKEFDHAQFNIAVADIPASFANQSIGELWVTYTVVLRKPKLVVNRAYNLDRDMAVLLSNGTGSQPLAVRPANEPLLGTSAAAAYVKYCRNNSIGIVYSPSPVTYAPVGIGVTGQRLTFPPAYGGTLQLRIELVIQNQAAPNTTVNGVGITNNGNITTVSDDPMITFAGTGMWSGGEGAGFGIAQGANGSQLLRITQIIHIDVKPATGGVQNWCDLYPVYGTQIPLGIHFAQIDVQEYNSSFRNRLDGTNDQMPLVDFNGNPVNFP